MPLVKHNLTQQMSIDLRVCHGDYSVFFKRLILSIFPDYVGQMLKKCDYSSYSVSEGAGEVVLILTANGSSAVNYAVMVDTVRECHR